MKKQTAKQSEKILTEMVAPTVIQTINHWLKKFPPNQKQSAVLIALRLVQEEHGFLTRELMDAVANYLEIPAISVYEVATFYSMYETKPVGRHIINVCTNISCKLRGASQIMQYLEEQLQINCGATTSDNRFTLRSTECLAACVNAPMMQVDKDYHENLTAAKIDHILQKYS